jgi:hypothetical protein
MADPAAQTAKWDCFCEIPQLDGEALAACQSDPSSDPAVSGAAVSGFCYVDGGTKAPVGNPAIVEPCPEDEKRLIRLLGKGQAALGATLFLSCLETSSCTGGAP